MSRQNLINLLHDRCYQEGDFTLSSGTKSNYYFDARMATLSPNGITMIGEQLFSITKDISFDAIGGLEIGALAITAAAVYTFHQHFYDVEGFFVRKQSKEHGTKKLIEGSLKPNSRVIIVDDVATTGKSILQAVNTVQSFNCTVVQVVVLVDRLEGASDLFQSHGIPFKSIFTINDISGNGK